jgi:hypothetical protein
MECGCTYFEKGKRGLRKLIKFEPPPFLETLKAWT